MNTGIPKTIHYCWFGGKPLPKTALKCKKSWKKYLPDYSIKEWNEANFNVYANSYIRDAYRSGKYAFVSDFARFWILYNYGGLYFDTDVEIITSMDEIIARGPFMGEETDSSAVTSVSVAPGLGLAAIPGMRFYKTMIDKYDTLSFLNPDGTLNLKTIVTHTTEELYKFGLKNSNGIQESSGLLIYPPDYFCPISVSDGKLRITKNTVSIHHYAQSWQSPLRKYGRKIILMVGGVRFKQAIKKILPLIIK